MLAAKQVVSHERLAIESSGLWKSLLCQDKAGAEIYFSSAGAKCILVVFIPL